MQSFTQKSGLFALFLTLSTVVAFAQTNVSGTLTDGENGETLIGATVKVLPALAGATTNEYGFFALSIPATAPDSVSLYLSSIGYDAKTIRIKTGANLRLKIELKQSGRVLNEVVIESNELEERIKSTEMSVTTLTTRQAKALPALFGEVDIIKILQLKPGITPGSEGTTGIFVRGGNSDQNLIVLDEAVVYNASHLFGFFSTFNSDAVKDLKVYKGGFPAQYGGRLSSVIDVRMKEGNNKKFTGAGGIGLISSRLTLEGPIQKDKSSFIISGRRTYADIITRMVNRRNEGKTDVNPIPDYYFYDLNTKVNFTLSERDRLYISGYFGRDVFDFSNEDFKFRFDWGNATGTARWNHIYGPKLFSNVTLTFSDYRYRIKNAIQGFSFNLGSNVKDSNAKVDYYYTPNNKHTLRFGGNFTYHDLNVARLKFASDDGQVNFESGSSYYGTEGGIYAADEYSATPKLKINYGLRLSGWAGTGANYGGIEPRLALNYELTNNLSLKGSYSRMNQYVHLLASSGLSLPTDIWYPSTKAVKPETSDQVAVGMAYLVRNDVLITWEAWYKRLNNQVELKDGAELFGSTNLETELAIGRGYAYSPLELEIEKKKGDWTGWIGYTLAWVRRGDFKEINGGKYFPPRNDTRHNLSVVSLYEFNKRWSCTGTFVYTSGYTSWLPSGRFTFQDIVGAQPQVAPIYGDRNTFRYPAYSRVDIGVMCRFFPRWGESDLTLSVYNATNRRNPYFLYLDVETKEVQNGGVTTEIPVGVKGKQVSLFPVLPSVTWNFKF
jgi:TonB dependent receptor/CarboxypepD_reg-like domain/TonB-dependent Receptor Plug Domain